MDPDPYWPPSGSTGSGSVKNEYGSETLLFRHFLNKWYKLFKNGLPFVHSDAERVISFEKSFKKYALIKITETTTKRIKIETELGE